MVIVDLVDASEETVEKNVSLQAMPHNGDFVVIPKGDFDADGRPNIAARAYVVVGVDHISQSHSTKPTILRVVRMRNEKPRQ